MFGNNSNLSRGFLEIPTISGVMRWIPVLVELNKGGWIESWEILSDFKRIIGKRRRWKRSFWLEMVWLNGGGEILGTNNIKKFSKRP